MDFGYSIEITGTDNSFQNTIVERPYRTLPDMVYTMLYSAGLGPEFWSCALIHAVFIRYRLPHAYFDYMETPYKAFRGRQPEL